MSQFLRKIGFIPKWGNMSQALGANFREKLAVIRRKKIENPNLQVSMEIEEILRGEAGAKHNPIARE